MAAAVKVGFIGGGKMSQAIASGFLFSGLVKPENVIASAVTENTLSIWKDEQIRMVWSGNYCSVKLDQLKLPCIEKMKSCNNAGNPSIREIIKKNYVRKKQDNARKKQDDGNDVI